MKVWAKPLLAVVLAATTLTPHPATALSKPDMSDITAAVPDGGDPKPPVPMKQITQCSQSALTPGFNVRDTPINGKALQIDKLHEIATGKGVKVAVIDSGVTPNPRLPSVQPGGDYVMGEDGLKDCDHHGTLVAGIIAAQPGPDDGFKGIAPDASLLSIRQTSGAFGPADEKDASKATSTLATLASGIVRAVNMGADVINMSVTSCYEANAAVDTNDLKAAINYAHQRGVVLVTAAGNADNDTCIPNANYDPAHPRDRRNWEGATHMSMPSFYTPNIISVGGVTATGDPFSATMSGPWVDIAAPATNVVSLDPERAGGLTNASVDRDGAPVALAGTSFASAYVAGVVALLLEQDPTRTPDEIEALLKHTAKASPDTIVNVVGAGSIDPLAALTFEGAIAPQQAPAPHDPPPLDPPQDPYRVAKAVTFGIAGLGMIALAGIAASKLGNRARKERHA